jgi:hypothetical protein
VDPTKKTTNARNNQPGEPLINAIIAIPETRTMNIRDAQNADPWKDSDTTVRANSAETWKPYANSLKKKTN